MPREYKLSFFHFQGITISDPVQDKRLGESSCVVQASSALINEGFTINFPRYVWTLQNISWSSSGIAQIAFTEDASQFHFKIIGKLF